MSSALKRSASTLTTQPHVSSGIEVALCTRDGECLGPLADVPSQTCRACARLCRSGTKLRRLQLDNNGVYKREQAREASPRLPQCSLVHQRLAYFM